MQQRELRTSCCPWIVDPSSGTSSSSTSPPPDPSSASSSRTPPSPASKRSDELASGNWSRDPPKNPEQKSKEVLHWVFGRPFARSSGIRWRSSQLISKMQKCLHPHTVLLTQMRNVLWKLHQGKFFYTHFPKDRIYEVCKRTKMTRALCRRRTGEAVEARFHAESALQEYCDKRRFRHW